MKIVYLVPWTKPLTGNMVTAQRLAQGLQKRGHKVDIFSATQGVESVDNADLVHTFNAVRTNSVLQEIRKRNRAIPWVVTLTGTDYTKARKELTEILVDTDGVVVFHKEAKETVLGLCPQLQKKIRVIPQAVEVPLHSGRRALRSKLAVKDNHVVFFLAAGLRPVKNLSLALKAFANLEEQSEKVHLWLAGPVMDEEEAERIFQLSKDLREFQYFGSLPHDEILSTYSAVDVFINSSRAEGMPGAVLEAMAARLPIIATNVPGNRNVIKSNETGILVDDNNVEELTLAMIELVEAPSERARLAEAAFDYVTKHHCPKAELDAIEQVYSDIL